MDDRSLVAQNTDDLDRDLQMTQQFDTSIGHCENQSKRQRWSIDGPVPVQVEHLGILATPTDHARAIIPRGAWQKLETAISVLAAIPGSHQVRLRLALACVRPRYGRGRCQL
eukprot:9479174-Pyramimonas_sp.AAC.1